MRRQLSANTRKRVCKTFLADSITVSERLPPVDTPVNQISVELTLNIN